MREDRPSATAAWVAAMRGLAPILPAGVRLAEDPYGLAFADGALGALARAGARFPPAGRALFYRGPLKRTMLWVQLRTRALDDVAIAFAREGGRQVVLLGAGYDARAARLPLEGARVFEVDHPATQAKKRRVLAALGAPTERSAFLPCNFEREELRELPARLAALGLDLARPTLTIWEGVTAYLTEAAIDATVSTVRALGGAGSQLALTYFERHTVEHAELGRLVRWLGEPYKFGWEPAALPAWLSTRGFSLVWDRADEALARAFMSADEARAYHGNGRHVALART